VRRHDAELVGDIAQYEDSSPALLPAGPEGIVIGLAERLT
jgi:hypothetical protein